MKAERTLQRSGRLTPSRARVMDALKQNGPNWVRTSRVAEDVGYSPQHAYQTLMDLWALKLVERDDVPTYRGYGYTWIWRRADWRTMGRETE